jgi:protein-S-isoprenylcysteine O-methyltransferase Ste14
VTRRYWFPKYYADTAQSIRVPAGFVLVALFAWLSEPSRWSLIVGLPVGFVGIVVRAWAAGHLAKNEELATGGPFGYVRNPLYVGTALAALGFAIASRQLWLGMLFAAAFALIYLPAIELEEQHLRKLFPGYERYAEFVPMLRPRFPSFGGGGRFRFSLYWRNQEYNALAGFALGAAYLAWRAGLIPGI